MKFLGVDYGLKRVGLAISEGELASAWKVIEINGLSDAIKKVFNIVKQEGIDKVVVGMPEGVIGKATQNFVKGLTSEGIDIIISDETLSTRQAENLMIKLGKSKKARKINDAIAASEILQNYLDNL